VSGGYLQKATSPASLIKKRSIREEVEQRQELLTILPPPLDSIVKGSHKTYTIKTTDFSPKARFVVPGTPFTLLKKEETFASTPSAEVYRALLARDPAAPASVDVAHAFIHPTLSSYSCAWTAVETLSLW
jgi:hypothetical protein